MIRAVIKYASILGEWGGYKWEYYTLVSQSAGYRVYGIRSPHLVGASGSLLLFVIHDAVLEFVEQGLILGPMALGQCSGFENPDTTRWLRAHSCLPE